MPTIDLVLDFNTTRYWSDTDTDTDASTLELCILLVFNESTVEVSTACPLACWIFLTQTMVTHPSTQKFHPLE